MAKSRLSDRQYFWLAAAVYAAILLAFALLLVTRGAAWEKYDTDRFFQMADTIIGGGTPYLDFQDPKPPLIFFSLVPLSLLGVKLTGGALLVAGCNQASALLILKTGWNLYGRFSGLLGGLLFVLNLPWIEGFFVLTEPFTLLFILASAYVLLFWHGRPKYLAAGALAGVAIGFKQYALLAVPLSLLLLYLKGELKGSIEFIAGILAVLVVIFGALFLAYGPAAAGAALYWSFGLAGEYVSSDNVGGVQAWKPAGAFEFTANLVFVTVAILTLLAYAAAGFIKGTRSTAEYFFFASGVAYLGTVLIRPYFHYILLALPFFALLCAGAFRDGPAKAYPPADGFKASGDK